MRLLSICAVGILSLLFSASVRADYALWVVTPESIDDVGGLSVEAKAEPSGMVRFVVRREGKEASGYLKGLLRLEVADNIWTEANVVADAREGATEYRFAVAPAHLDIATFNLILTEGLGGEWYEIRLKEFVAKAEPVGSTDDSPQSKP